MIGSNALPYAEPISSDAAKLIRLPECFGRETANDVRQRILEVLHRAGEAKRAAELLIDGSNVVQIDTAAIQLMLSTARSFEAAGGTLRWYGSETFMDGFEQVGFAGIYYRYLEK